MACPDCFKGALHTGTPGGIEEIIHGINTYIASPSSFQASNNSTIIFITDAFGFNLPNSKLLADFYAVQTGCRVLVPDIIPGGGVPLVTLSLTEAVTSPISWWDLRGRAAWLMSLVHLLSIVVPFGIRSRGVFPTVLEYARAIKEDLSGHGKLGVAGFCWGGLQSTKLCAEPAVEGGSDGLVNAHFAAHPVNLKPEDFVASVKTFGAPFSMAVGANDAYLKPDAVAAVEAALRTECGENAWEVKIYEDCGHGFAVRADEGRVIENEAAGKAAEQAIGFFRKYLA